MSTSVRLFSALEADGKTPFLGALHQSAHVNLSALLRERPALASSSRTTTEPTSIDHLLGSGLLESPEWFASLEACLNVPELARRYHLDESRIRWRPPITSGRKIIAVARNYAKHASELGNAVPSDLAWFAKFPSVMAGHREVVQFPDWLDGDVHHEAELALVIGRTMRNVPESQALSYIAGYTIANDLTARAVQDRAKEARMPWTAGKNLDGFCPIGPVLAPAFAIPDPQGLRVICRINGDVKQDGPTSDMLFPVATMLHVLSTWLTLEVGDIILTGTPAGVGAVKRGDTVECEIPGIGCLQTRIASSDRPA